MQVSLNNINNTNFNGSLKIYGLNNPYKVFTDNSIKNIEKLFSTKTKGQEGHMDVILINRINAVGASPDKIFFKDGEYTDFVDTIFKKCQDEISVVEKLVDVFNKFKDIENFKNSVMTLFK